MKCYIAGPMRGYTANNFPAFEAAEKALEDRGVIAVSPHRTPAQACPEDYLKADIELLVRCDAICLLEGWERSVGARCEVAVAITIGLQFVDCFGGTLPRPSSVTVDEGYSD